MKRRRFNADGIMHIYQRTISGFNLFYSVEDFLALYTVISTKAKYTGVKILGICMMIDHIHLLISSDNLNTMSRFISAYSSLYAKVFNARTGRRGPLFETPYGSAAKPDMKRIRSAIAYLFNNPVEKHLCKKAEEYRWNFLAYYGSAGSETGRGNHSLRLKNSMAIVSDSYRRGRHLNHTIMENLAKDLSPGERETLTDHIITVYWPFDHTKAIDCYGSYKDMLIAINSNTGSEYDIAETDYGKSDRPYREIISYMKKVGHKDLHRVITLPPEEKLKMLNLLKANTSATYTQIRKFLHIPPP